MKAGGGTDALAVALRLLLVATACGILFALLNLPDFRRTGGERAGGSSGVRLPVVQQGQRVREARRLSVVTEEIDGLQSDETAAEEDEIIAGSSPGTKETIWMMQDQLLMAKAYLHFASPQQGSAHLVRELKLRMKEIGRAISHSSGGTRVPGSALQKMKAMEATLSKAQRIYPHCSRMTSKLRAMAHNAEDLVRAHQSESSFLEQVAVRTLPKGHHCLAMRLTSEYFSLDPTEREFPERNNSQQMDGSYHYALFSDSVLASAVVVNSTVAASKDPRMIMFHIVTDALNFPAMKMWFLTNPPVPATIQVESLEDLEWLPTGFTSRFKKEKGIHDPRYTSALNHLRFYLPEVFPSLSKVLLLDHDVVIQKDLSGLWDTDMKGKVVGAVEARASGSDGYHHRLDSLVDFSDPSVFDGYDAKARVFSFGVNVFDLDEWRKQGLTATYHKWFQAGRRRRLWKAGSLPLAQLVFYNQTVPLDRRWHVEGLGHSSSSLEREEIESAAVLHYSGKLKPWLEISVSKYRDYWNKYLNYDNPYLQQCNIHV